jgi:hypothetical protein
MQYVRTIRKHPGTGSAKTQRNRRSDAWKICGILSSKFPHLNAWETSHRQAFWLVEKMEEEGLSIGYQKGLMTTLRYLTTFSGGSKDQIAATNDYYGIGRRQSVTNTDKSIKLTPEHLEKITSPFIRMSLQLQDAFCLRAQESMLVQMAWAHHFDAKGREWLRLKASWCKGDRERQILVRTEEQRALIAEAKELSKTTPKGSLIPGYPPDDDGKRRDMKHHEKEYKKQTKSAGCSHTHGLRHGAAQRYYSDRVGEIVADRYGSSRSGWKCKTADGLMSTELAKWQFEIDRIVRIEIMRMLGHGDERWDVVAIYLGT